MAVINWRCNAIEELDHDPALLHSPRGRRFPGVSEASRRIRGGKPPEHVDLAIVGGGIVGTALACQFWHSPALRGHMALLDAELSLVGRYFQAMTAVGQRVMRSPYEHQIAPDNDLQLLDFARLHLPLLTPLEQGQVRLALSGQRAVVPLDVFEAHTTHTIGGHQLGRWSYQFPVVSMRRGLGDRWILGTRDGRTLTARTVLLTVGSRERPRPTSLVDASTWAGTRVRSAFAPPRRFLQGEVVCIVGSGQSAAHLLLAALAQGAHPIWMIRHEERYSCADFDTSYFRTEGIASFRRLDLPERAAVLAEENRGSIMLEFYPLLAEMESKGRLKVYREQVVTNVAPGPDRQLCLGLSSGVALQVDTLILAVGLEPDSRVLPADVSSVGGYPVIDEGTLEVMGQENLFVAGPLASLALGPAAKNIDGARLAAERLLPALEDRLEPSRTSGSSSLAGRISGTSSIRAPVATAG